MKPLKRFGTCVLLALTLGLLAGCPGMPLKSLKFEDQVANVLQGADEGVSSARLLMRTGVISPENAISVARMAMTVKEGAVIALDLSNSACKPDDAPPSKPADPVLPLCSVVKASATARLRLAAAALDSLNAYTAKPGGK